MRNPFLLTGEIFGVVSAHQSPPRGSGKSLIALHLVLEQANYFNYAITFNFDIDATALYHYCYYMGYHNVIRHLRLGNIHVRSLVNDKGQTDLTSFILGNQRIFVLDEAGIFCSSRNWQKISDKWQADLAMLRHFNVRLWWISQHYSHVDKVLRNQSNYIIECSSFLKPSRELQGASKILMKIYYVYINKSYEYLDNKAPRISGLNLNMHRFRGAFFRKFIPFNDSDLLLFRVYKSFSKNIGYRPVISNFPNFSGYNSRSIHYYSNHEFQDIYNQNYEKQIKELAAEFFPISSLPLPFSHNKYDDINDIFAS